MLVTDVGMPIRVNELHSKQVAFVMMVTDVGIVTLVTPAPLVHLPFFPRFKFYGCCPFWNVEMSIVSQHHGSGCYTRCVQRIASLEQRLFRVQYDGRSSSTSLYRVRQNQAANQRNMTTWTTDVTRYIVLKGLGTM